VYCAECGIRFLTHPRNAGRQDLRCPFGCRQHHRRQRSCQRSIAYYRTAAGRLKKKWLNARRQDGQVAPATPSPSAGDLQVPPAQPAREPVPVPPELRPEEVAFDEWSVAHSPMLPYVRMVVSLIAGVAFTCGELVQLLRQALRQHSIGAHRGPDYLLGFLQPRPP